MKHGQFGENHLPRDFTQDELDAAPVLATMDELIIDDLTHPEYDAFIAALSD